ncbi:hypothetical protein C1O66_17145 [Paucibacter aquatile]|uniref:Uncharacterized protein n=1 Tax=Kinneretia aquatilis TaxID=2070761 RepID=A0A2N8L037_9BURK|nr:hypothetical protein C1O66_17145 [Paucibacter aquatile]
MRQRMFLEEMDRVAPGPPGRTRPGAFAAGPVGRDASRISCAPSLSLQAKTQRVETSAGQFGVSFSGRWLGQWLHDADRRLAPMRRSVRFRSCRSGRAGFLFQLQTPAHTKIRQLAPTGEGGNQALGLAQVLQRVAAKPGHVARIAVNAEQVLGVSLGDLAEEEAWGLEEGEVGHGVFSRWGQSEPGGVRIGKLCSQRPSGTPGKTAWDFKFKV